MEVKVREGTIDELLSVTQKLPEFTNPYPKEEYRRRFQQVNSILLVAEVDHHLAGVKAGYDRFGDGDSFYSWMGGVVPEYRGHGIALRLLMKMEEWCREKGYQKLKFKTLNRHRSMITFAFRYGFALYDFRKVDPASDSKLYFEKSL